MTKGDIIIISRDNKEELLIAYDKHTAIQSSLLNTKLIQVDLLDSSYNIEVYSLNKELSYSRKKNLTNFLVGLVTHNIKPSLRERLDFTKYIISSLNNYVDIKLLENLESYTINNLKMSNKLYKYI